MEDLGQKLKQYMKSGTPAERRIARYFSDHMNELPYETASSVADRLELSPMTVGRFLRALGYQGLDGFKVHLREAAPASAPPNPAVVEQLQQDAAIGRPLAILMSEQLEMLHHVYGLAGQTQWTEAVSTILSATEVFVAAHQSAAGLGQHLCDRLSHVRDRVRTTGAGTATYAEFLGSSISDGLLVIIDSHRFGKSRLLARSARRAGLKVLLITGQYTDWAHEFANLILSLPPARFGERDNLVAVTALIELLSSAVIQSSGEEGETRGRRIEELENIFADVTMR